MTAPTPPRPSGLKAFLQRLVSVQPQANQTLGETAADVALGFTPLQYPQAARDFVRAKREGSGLGMGLAAASMVPVVGGFAKAAGKADDAIKIGSKLKQFIASLGDVEVVRDVPMKGAAAHFDPLGKIVIGDAAASAKNPDGIVAHEVSHYLWGRNRVPTKTRAQAWADLDNLEPEHPLRSPHYKDLYGGLLDGDLDAAADEVLAFKTELDPNSLAASKVKRPLVSSRPTMDLMTMYKKWQSKAIATDDAGAYGRMQEIKNTLERRGVQFDDYGFIVEGQ